MAIGELLDLDTSFMPSAAMSQRLLDLLLRHLGTGLLVFGLDETIDRRSGPRMEAKGVYRNTVRSSYSHNCYAWCKET